MSPLNKASNHYNIFDLLWKNVRDIYFRMYLKSKGVESGNNVILKGRPVICRFTGIIRIGNNVILRSHDYGYHTSIYAPVRLMTDTREDAMIEIGDNTRINGASIHATEKIIIGRNCLIASNATIIDSDGHGIIASERGSVNPVSSPVIIEDNVWIGMNTIILKGVRIGMNSVIGAGSVVTKSIPPDCVAAGNPARIIKNIDNISEMIDERSNTSR